MWTERHRPAIGRLGIGGTRKLSWPRPHAPQVGKSRGAAAGAVDGLAPCYGRHAPVAPVQMQYQSRALRQRPPAAALRHGGLPGPGQRQDPDALPAASCPIIFCHVRPAAESTAGPAAGCLRALAGLLPRHSRRDCLARYMHRPRLRQVVAQGGGRQWRPVQGRRCAILRPSSRSPPRRGRGRCIGAAQSGPVRVPCGAAIVPSARPAAPAGVRIHALSSNLRRNSLSPFSIISRTAALRMCEPVRMLSLVITFCARGSFSACAARRASVSASPTMRAFN